MQTQLQGTDISGDVSFTTSGGFAPLYRFKANIVRAVGFLVGVFDVTINVGEGIDIDHAEIDIFQGARIVDEVSIDCLHWHVEQRPSTPAGEIVYRVTFEMSVFVPAVDTGPADVVCTPTDPAFASITIRRKVPAVN